MKLVAVWVAYARGTSSDEEIKQQTIVTQKTLHRIKKKVDDVILFCQTNHPLDNIIVETEASMSQPTLAEWTRRRSRLGRAPHERATHVAFLQSMSGTLSESQRVQALFVKLRLYAATCDVT